MKVRELITVLGFDIEDKKLKALDEQVDKITYGLLGLSATVVGTGVALFAFVKTSATAADAIYKTALAAGVGTKELQTLGYAASLSGASMEELGVGLKFLSKNMLEASKNPAGEMAKSFAAIGVRATDASGKVRNAGDVLLDLADKFSQISNPTEKAALSMQFFGKSGGNLLEFLSKGRGDIAALAQEFEAFALSEEQILTLKDFNDAVTATLAVVGALKDQLAAAVAPEIKEMVDQFRRWVIANKELIKTNLGEFLKGVIGYFWILFRGAMSLADAFLYLAKHMGGVEKMTKLILFGLTAIISGMVINGIVSVTKAMFGLAAATGLAALKPLLVIAAFAALAAAIFLIADDIVAYFQGRKSVTGIIVKAFTDAFAKVREGWTFFKDWFLSDAESWIKKVATLFLALNPAVNLGSLLSGHGLPIAKFVKSIMDGKKPTMEGLFDKKGLFGDVDWSALTRQYLNSGSVTGVTPNTAPLGGASVPFRNATTVGGAPSVVQHNTINVQASGVTPQQAAQSVETGTKQSVDELIRRAGQVTSPAVGY
jgi:hypothetical protein